MKRIQILPLLLLGLLVVGCSNYGYVRLNYPKPPAANLPEEIHTLAVVNRSLTSEEDKEKKLLEAIASGEIVGSDKLASDECLKGAFDATQEVDWLNLVFPKESRMEGTGTRETPQLLEWENVEAICNETDAEALLVLEMFDSNTDLLLSAAAEQVTAILTGSSPRPRVPNQVKMNVKCYWRLYNPKTREVIDQYQQSHQQSFNLNGNIPPLDALPRTAYSAGNDYIHRFFPSYYTVKRDMYKRASGSVKGQFKKGFRRAEVGNWDGAIEVWTSLIDRAKEKAAGRACLNIAVGYEALGNTQKAFEWAQKSYEDYGDKLGRNYAKVLLRRKNIER